MLGIPTPVLVDNRQTCKLQGLDYVHVFLLRVCVCTRYMMWEPVLDVQDRLVLIP